MILIDAGVIIGVIDQADPHHTRCIVAVEAIADQSLITTWPCIAEAMHLLYRVGGYRYQRELWEMWEDGSIAIHEFSEANIRTAAMLMAKYSDVPMDLADATLVAVAEETGIKKILTLDSHFRIYRLGDGSVLNVVP
jgi:predicted nucleic acid-binding protein